MEELKGLNNALVVLLIEYVIVLFAIFADLVSGLRKAKQRGEIRSSYGLRQTVDKITRYYNLLFVVSLIDLVLTVSQIHPLLHLPVLPFFTSIGTIFLCLIELKSIYEKAEDKVKVENVGQLAGMIIKNRENMEAVLSAIVNYLKEDKNEPK